MFATDAILAALMCCPRSVYSFDIIVQKVGKKIFFDKRDDSEFGMLFPSLCAGVITDFNLCKRTQ